MELFGPQSLLKKLLNSPSPDLLQTQATRNFDRLTIRYEKELIKYSGDTFQVHFKGEADNFSKSQNNIYPDICTLKQKKREEHPQS